MKSIFFIALIFFSTANFAQTIPFENGKWEGLMHIYKLGKLTDTVTVELTIQNIYKDSVWQWKTVYNSPKTPVVKDYTLRVKDASRGIYITDEGEGIELLEYLADSSMYCQFETSGFMISSVYKWENGNIYYELTSASKIKKSKNDIYNFTIPTLQKVVFRKRTE